MGSKTNTTCDQAVLNSGNCVVTEKFSFQAVLLFEAIKLKLLTVPEPGLSDTQWVHWKLFTLLLSPLGEP